MSMWTYVSGSITINSNKKYAKSIVNKINGMITGSEGDCEVFLNHSKMISGTKKSLTGFKKEHNHYVISLSGLLRDRTESDTEEEIKKVIELLNKECFILSFGIVVSDGFSTKTFNI